MDQNKTSVTKPGTVDRRVRKTKKQLRQGLTQLLQTKNINEISVRELSDLVDINRGTFYLHYRDIYDLLDQIEQRRDILHRQILNVEICYGGTTRYAG